MIQRALIVAFAAAATLAAGGAARAQGLLGKPSLFASPSAPWAGPYVGLHGGYGWDPDIVDTVGELQVNKTATANGVRPPFLSETRRGYMAGGQIGWNVQRGMFVAGIEADASLTDLSNKSTYAIPVRFGQAEQGRKTRLYDRTNYIGTARARLGIANGPLLIYGTGGFAYSQVHNDGIFDSSQLTHLDYEGHSATDLTGWVAGGGVEYLLPGGFQPSRDGAGGVPALRPGRLGGDGGPFRQHAQARQHGAGQLHLDLPPRRRDPAPRPERQILSGGSVGRARA